MILQEKNYIAQQKKKHLILGAIATILVFGMFIAGLLLTKTRANLFTVSACVMAIGASLFITRFISFSRYKDGDPKRAEMLEEMQGDYAIFHSAIIPTNKGTACFEHVVVAGEKIYFIAYAKQQVDKYHLWIKDVLGGKGITSSNLYFLVAKDNDQMKKHTRRIEKESGYETNYSKAVSEILM